MRKTFLCTAAAFLFLTKTNTAFAQNSASIAKLSLSYSTKIIPSPGLAGSVGRKAPHRSEISIRAQRDFVKKYKEVSDAKWHLSDNGLIAVYFTHACIQVRRHYDKNGVFDYMIRYYNEDRLPRDVRHIVKAEYYDFDIFQITEFSRNDKIAYLLKIHDKRSWKTIKIVDKEMEVVDEFPKR